MKLEAAKETRNRLYVFSGECLFMSSAHFLIRNPCYLCFYPDKPEAVLKFSVMWDN